MPLKMEDLPNRDKRERLSIIERQCPGASIHIACMHMSRIEKGFKGEVTDDDIRMATEMIIEKFIDLTIADIKYFAKWFMSREIFGKINANKIISTFGEFYVSRENAYADYREFEHSKLKAQEGNGFAKFDYKKMLSQAEAERVAKIEAKKNRKPVINTQNFKAEDFEKKEL